MKFFQTKIFPSHQNLYLLLKKYLCDKMTDIGQFKKPKPFFTKTRLFQCTITQNTLFDVTRF